MTYDFDIHYDQERSPPTARYAISDAMTKGKRQIHTLLIVTPDILNSEKASMSEGK
jgi:hypothetical protein